MDVLYLIWMYYYSSLGWLLLQLATHTMTAAAEAKVKDQAFPNTTWLFNRKVTCNNVPGSELVFPAETWSCRDMRIDGHRMRYWYRVPDHHCTDAPEDFDSNLDSRKNDVSGFCEALLRVNKIHKPLRAAFIHEPSCGHSMRERMLLVRNSTSQHGYRWELFKAGRGYMRTLRCMVAD